MFIRRLISAFALSLMVSTAAFSQVDEPADPNQEAQAKLTLEEQVERNAQQIEAIKQQQWVLNNLKPIRAQQAKTFSVQVKSITANYFLGKKPSGHGTGFILDLNEKRGLIATNNHVIDKNDFEGQRIELKFPSKTGQPEKIEGHVIFKSMLRDFAIIEFDPNDLKRVRDQIQVAPIPTKEQYAQIVRQGKGVMPYGYPLSGEEITTFGTISGIAQRAPDGDLYTQTDAAINPGNSGGPSIELESGMVIGMNTLKFSGADNTGLMIPIIDLVDEWKRFQADPNYGMPSHLYLRLQYVPLQLYLERRAGMRELVESIDPNIEAKFGRLLKVVGLVDNSPLYRGDIILTLGGQLIGDRYDIFNHHIQNTPSGKIAAKVIRGDKIVDVVISVKSMKEAMYKSANEYVYFSGFVFQESVPRFNDLYLDGTESSVMITEVLPGTPAESVGQIPVQSVVEALEVHGKVYDINTLEDIRDALMETQAGTDTVSVYYREFSQLQTMDGNVIENLASKSQALFREVPVQKVFSHIEIPVSDLYDHIDWTGMGQHGRKALQIKGDCGNILRKIAPKA
jgi:S1-C subfamily serine protease